jgi:cephalosporin hydroxylase
MDTALWLPPTAAFDVDGSCFDYWAARIGQHVEDVYAGVPISKFPEDLRAYEHILWHSCPQAVIEIGTQFGGSALWFRDRLRTLAAYGRVHDPLVVSVDVDVDLARGTLARSGHDLDGIVLIEGDVLDPSLPDLVAAQLPERTPCLVVEDSAHVYETTAAALRGFARFVQLGGFFVVEDTCLDIDALRLSDDWPRGVLAAVRDWFKTPDAAGFTVQRDLEIYGVTCHPYGFLQRVAPPTEQHNDREG